MTPEQKDARIAEVAGKIDTLQELTREVLSDLLTLQADIAGESLRAEAPPGDTGGSAGAPFAPGEETGGAS